MWIFCQTANNLNQAGIGRAVVDLTVKEVDVFRAIKSERVVVVDEGKDAFLAVDVVTEKIQVIWSKLGIDVIENESRYQLIESGHKRILKISNAEIEDRGKWKIRSGDKEGTTFLIHSYNIIIQTVPEMNVMIMPWNP